MSNLIDNNLLRQIIPSSVLEKVTKFGGLSLLTKNKIINVQSLRAQNPPPLGLNSVN